MSTLSSDSQKLLELLKNGKKLTAMVAPSFPCDFTEEQIVFGLKTLGFDKVVDHSLAIASVNKAYEDLLEEKPGQLFITANCPATVSLIKTQFPELERYLGPVNSPMVCCARICKEKFPENLNVFIGPCLAKKAEAKNYPHEITLALTYKEIIEVFIYKGINYKNPPNQKKAYQFESFHSDFLHLFPTSGGVKATISQGFLMEAEIIVADGIKELTELFTALKEKRLSSKIRFLDVLFCQGGCIGGPGIKSDEPLACRKARFLLYRNKKKDLPLCSEADIKSAIDPKKCPIQIK